MNSYNERSSKYAGDLATGRHRGDNEHEMKLAAILENKEVL